MEGGEKLVRPPSSISASDEGERLSLRGCSSEFAFVPDPCFNSNAGPALSRGTILNGVEDGVGAFEGEGREASHGARRVRFGVGGGAPRRLRSSNTRTLKGNYSEATGRSGRTAGDDCVQYPTVSEKTGRRPGKVRTPLTSPEPEGLKFQSNSFARSSTFIRCACASTRTPFHWLV